MIHGLARGSPAAAPGPAFSRRPCGVAASPVPAAAAGPERRLCRAPARAPRSAFAQAPGPIGIPVLGAWIALFRAGKAAGIEQPALLPRGAIPAEKVELFTRVT